MATTDDNNLAIDSPSTPSEVYGRTTVRAVKRDGGIALDGPCPTARTADVDDYEDQLLVIVRECGTMYR